MWFLPVPLDGGKGNDVVYLLVKLTKSQSRLWTAGADAARTAHQPCPRAGAKPRTSNCKVKQQTQSDDTMILGSTQLSAYSCLYLSEQYTTRAMPL